MLQRRGEREEERCNEGEDLGHGGAYAGSRMPATSSSTHDLVDEVEALRTVRDEQDRAAVGGLEHVADELLGGRLVEVRRRLVEDEHRSIREQRACDARRWRWPPESCDPSSPTSVSSPSGSDATQSSRRARRSASTSSASVAVGPREPEVLADASSRRRAPPGRRAANVAAHILLPLAREVAARRS